MFKENDRVILKNISEDILRYDNHFSKVNANRILENYKKGHLIVCETEQTGDFLNVTLYDAVFNEDDHFICGLINEKPELNKKPFTEIEDLLDTHYFNNAQIDYFESTSLELNIEVFENFLE